MVTLITIKVAFVIPVRISDAKVRSDLTKLAVCGAGKCFVSHLQTIKFLITKLCFSDKRYTVFFLTGFALWNIDQIFCSDITATKRWMGMPWSFIFELHGWWHILTGVGVYICNIPLLLFL